MKVLVVGPQFPDSFARNIAITLERMGHKVVGVCGKRARHHGGRVANLFWIYTPKAFPALERMLFRGIAHAATAVQPDLILVTHGALPPEVVSELRSVSCGKLVCWYTDPAVNLDRQYLLASGYEAFFFKEPFLVRAFRDKLGASAHYLPECCNPVWHRRVQVAGEDFKRYGCALAAQGTLHYFRARMLETFAGYDMKIWGRNCPSWLSSAVKDHYAHQYVAEAEKAKAFLSAKIVINTIHFAEIEGVNCTLFEAAGCGAFQIADWKSALPDLFEPEREIVTFRTRAELKEKVDFYLARPEERQEIADRAYARAQREHTYEKRLLTMFQILGLASESEPARELIATATP